MIAFSQSERQRPGSRGNLTCDRYKYTLLHRATRTTSRFIACTLRGTNRMRCLGGFLIACSLVVGASRDVVARADTAQAHAPVIDSVRFTAEGLPSPTSGAVEALAPREVLKAFLKEHPNYVVDVFAMPGIQGSSMDS